jgi:transcriptional regulator of met regulon
MGVSLYIRILKPDSSDNMVLPKPIKVQIPEDLPKFMRALEDKDSPALMASGIGFDEASKLSKEDALYYYGALNTSKAQHAKNKEIEEGIEFLNKKVQDFLKKKGLKDSLIVQSSDKSKKAVAQEQTKKQAEELYNEIYDNELIRKWNTSFGADAEQSALEQYGQKNCLQHSEEHENFRNLMFWKRTKIAKEQFIGMFASFNDLSKKNEHLQKVLASIALSMSKIATTEKTLEIVLEDGDGNAKDTELDQAMSPYMAYTKNFYPHDEFVRSQTLSILKRTLAFRTHDIGINYGHALTPAKEKKSIDDQLNDPETYTKYDFIADDNFLKESKTVLLMQLVKSSNFIFTHRANKELESTHKEYSAITEAFLSKNGFKKGFNLEERVTQSIAPPKNPAEYTRKLAQELDRELLYTWVKKRWSAIGADKYLKGAMDLAKKDPYFFEALHEAYLGVRGEQMVELLSQSKNIVDNEEMGKMYTRMGQTSIRYYVSESRLQRMLLKDAMEKKDSKYKDLQKAASLIAASAGYEIKDGVLEGPDFIRMAEEYALRTYNPAGEFPVEPMKDNPILNKKGEKYF